MSRATTPGERLLVASDLTDAGLGSPWSADGVFLEGERAFDFCICKLTFVKMADFS